MIDFAPLREEKVTIADLAEGLDMSDLRALTIEMLDIMSALVAECVDADVVLVPDDPDANDTYASSDDEISLSWTLGHVIVHTTASAEEAAFLGTELARGVKRRGGRARREVPWETVTTIAQVQHRLKESRRMRLASLDMWPDEPYLDNNYMRKRGLYINAVSQFLLGLLHDDSHVQQIANIVAQGKAARAATPALQEF